MSQENPTADSGASIQDRLESFLSAEEAPQEQQASEPKEPELNAEEPKIEPESGEQEDDQQPQLSTTDFAKMLGIDESTLDLDTDGNAIIKTKIDGKEGTAKFADVLKSYQLQGHIDNKARAVADQERAIQARMAEVESVAQSRLQQVDALANVAQQELTREFQSIDWTSLRINDPGEYSAKLADYQHRQAQLQQVFGQVEQSKQQHQHQIAEQTKAMLAREADLLPTLIPEWKDAAVADAERKSIVDYGLKAGIPAEDLNMIQKASHVAVLRKAMLYDQLQQTKSTVENKVRTAPKLVKAGQPQESSRQQQTVTNLKTQVRKTGGKGNSIADYLLATGKA